MTSTEPGAVKKTLIELKGADVAINRQTLIKNFFWEVKTKENWSVIGPNGSGKSLLAGLWPGALNQTNVFIILNQDSIQGNLLCSCSGNSGLRGLE